jgi:hypothetical protein
MLTEMIALNYAFVGVGLAVSAVFLFRNLYVLPRDRIMSSFYNSIR